MKITINIKEEAIFKWGTIVLTNLSPDPEESIEAAVPGFKYKVDEKNTPFVINRTYGDIRDGKISKKKATEKKK